MFVNWFFFKKFTINNINTISIHCLAIFVTDNAGTFEKYNICCYYILNFSVFVISV